MDYESAYKLMEHAVGLFGGDVQGLKKHKEEAQYSFPARNSVDAFEKARAKTKKLTLDQWNGLFTIWPQKDRNRRWLIDAPSGSGKTFVAVRLVCEFVRYPGRFELTGGVLLCSHSKRLQKKTVEEVQEYMKEVGHEVAVEEVAAHFSTVASTSTGVVLVVATIDALLVMSRSVTAGQLMQRVLNDLVDGLTSAGWRKWCEFVFADVDAEDARGQLSELEKLQERMEREHEKARNKLERENEKLLQKLDKEKLASEKKQEQTIADLQDQLEREQNMKAGKKMRDCLNMICNALFTQAWEQWNACLGKTKNAGKVMQRVLNTVVDGLTTAGWTKWCDFMVVSAAHEAKDDELQLMLGDMKSQLQQEVMVRAASVMTHCLNLTTERLSREALRFWQESCIASKRAFGVAIVRKLSQFIKILQTRITVLLWSYWSVWKNILEHKILDQIMLEIEQQEQALASRDARVGSRARPHDGGRRRSHQERPPRQGAGSESLALYKELLEMAMNDGVMEASESHRLSKARKRHGITSAQHDVLLAEVSMNAARGGRSSRSSYSPPRSIMDSLADVGIFGPPQPPVTSQPVRRSASTSQSKRRSSGSASTRRRGSRDVDPRDARDTRETRARGSGSTRARRTSAAPAPARSSVRWKSSS
jgi:hypothetical protein